MATSQLPFLPSFFEHYSFTDCISGISYKYRVLNLSASIFIYIGQEGDEVFNEMTLAIQTGNGQIISTRILGAIGDGESQAIAEVIAKKLNKEVYVSCNISADKMLRPRLVKHLCDEIKRCPERF